MNTKLAAYIKALRDRNVDWATIVGQCLSAGDIEEALTFYMKESIKEQTCQVKIFDSYLFNTDGASYRNQKIHAIKLTREHTGCGLKEAKDFVEGCSLVVDNSTIANNLVKAFGREYSQANLVISRQAS